MLVATGLAVAAGTSLACLWKRSRAGYYFKYTSFVVVVVVFTVVTLPWMLVRGVFLGRTSSFPWMAVFAFDWVGRWVFGLRYGFVQSPDEVKRRLVPGAVVVANHQSCMDSFAATFLWRTIWNLSIVAKKKIMFFPPAAILGYLTGFTFIDRKKPKEALSLLSKGVIENQKTATSTLIFPEGTRSHHPDRLELSPFKKGAFVAAIDARVPIVPVVIPHYKLLNHETKTLLPMTCNLNVLEPIPSEGWTVEDLMAETRRRMQTVFEAS